MIGIDEITGYTVAQLRSLVRDCPTEDLPELLEVLGQDQRSGVQSIVKSTSRRLEHERQEMARVNAMYELQSTLGGTGLVLGIDEVGRGSVAGPLTVAAVALPLDRRIWGIDDSKQLTPSRREELAVKIKDVALAIGIAHIPPESIDACGMASCLRMAMSRAVESAGVDPDAVLIDGLPMHVHPREVCLVHGDSRVASIAAASIIAKVTRDALMVEYDSVYPGYDLAASKGYASAKHIAAIKAHGLTPIHRATFCEGFLHDEDDKQSHLMLMS